MKIIIFLLLFVLPNMQATAQQITIVDLNKAQQSDSTTYVDRLPASTKYFMKAADVQRISKSYRFCHAFTLTKSGEKVVLSMGTLETNVMKLAAYASILDADITEAGGERIIRNKIKIISGRGGFASEDNILILNISGREWAGITILVPFNEDKVGSSLKSYIQLGKAVEQQLQLPPKSFNDKLIWSLFENNKKYMVNVKFIDN